MKVIRLVLEWFIIFVVLMLTPKLKLNTIPQFIVMFIALISGLFLVDRFLPKKADRKAEK